MCVAQPSKDPLPAPEVIPRTALEFGFKCAQGAAALAGAVCSVLPPCGRRRAQHRAPQPCKHRKPGLALTTWEGGGARLVYNLGKDFLYF